MAKILNVDRFLIKLLFKRLKSETVNYNPQIPLLLIVPHLMLSQQSKQASAMQKHIRNSPIISGLAFLWSLTSVVPLSRRTKWVTGLMMWPNGPTHQSDIFFLSKGQGWHRMTWRVSSTSSQHAKMPGLKCQRCMFPVSSNVWLHFQTCTFSSSLHQ